MYAMAHLVHQKALDLTASEPYLTQITSGSPGSLYFVMASWPLSLMLGSARLLSMSVLPAKLNAARSSVQ